MSRHLLPLVVVALLVAFAASATTIHVDHAGGGQFETIQEGIDAASEGDTVLVAAGTYIGEQNRNLDFGGTNIKLISESGSPSTIIDCENEENTRCIRFHSNEDSTSVVSGFTLTRGNIYNAGGVYIGEGCAPNIDHCRFASNHGEHGGALYCNTATTRLLSCQFIDNVAGQSGGAATFYQSNVRMFECRFEGNTTGGAGGRAGIGGAIYFQNCDAPRLSDVEFRENTAANDGGAIYSFYSHPQIIDSSFTDNESIGGAAILISYSSPAIMNCRFIGNRGVETGGAVACCQGSFATITDCVFAENGLSSGTSEGGAIYIVNASASIMFCTFVGDSAHEGGEISFLSGATPDTLWHVFRPPPRRPALLRHGNLRLLVLPELGLRRREQRLDHADRRRARRGVPGLRLPRRRDDVGAREGDVPVELVARAPR